VVNLTNHLTVRSALKILPSFGGADFDATKVSTPFTDPDLTELFDIAARDLDADGKPDLVATKTNNGAPATDIIIYKNQSTIGKRLFLQSLIKPICRFWTFPRPQQTLPVAIWMAMASQRLSPPGWGQPETKYLYCAHNSVAGTLSFASVQKVLFRCRTVCLPCLYPRFESRRKT